MATRRNGCTGMALAGLLVVAVGCGTKAATPAASAPPAPSNPSPAVTVRIVTDPATIGAYTPPTATVTAGQSVAWDWEDINPHTVTSDNAGLFDSGVNTKGKTFVHTFDTPGTHAYHCMIHPSMHGAIVVR